MEAIFKDRINKVKKILQEKSLDAVLVSNPKSRFFLSGFELNDTDIKESSGWLLITANGDDWLYINALYRSNAEQHWSKENIFVYKKSLSEIGEQIKSLGLKKIGFSELHLLSGYHRVLSQFIKLEPCDGLVEGLRLIKTNDELDCLKASCNVNHNMFNAIQSKFKVGMTEKDLAWEVEKMLKEQGAQELSFETVVAFGTNSALPHAVPGDKKLEDNMIVLIDSGCRYKDYCSDKTRTFFFGENDEAFKAKKAIVEKAQAAAIKLAKPGVKISDLHNAALAIFKEHGVDDLFIHGLGHGVGLNVHEAPSVSGRSNDVLKTGMVITIEPGIYDISWGGIRHEDMFVITEDGCEML